MLYSTKSRLNDDIALLKTNLRCLSIFSSLIQSVNVLELITFIEVVSLEVDLYLYSRSIPTIYTLSSLMLCIYFSMSSYLAIPLILYFTSEPVILKSIALEFMLSIIAFNCFCRLVRSV